MIEKFTLTRSTFFPLIKSIENNDFTPLLSIIDPDVKWIIGTEGSELVM